MDPRRTGIKNFTKVGVLLLAIVAVVQFASIGESGERSWISAQGATATYQPTSTMVPTPNGGVPTTSATEPVNSVVTPGAAFDYTATPPSGSTLPPPLKPTPSPNDLALSRAVATVRQMRYDRKGLDRVVQLYP